MDADAIKWISGFAISAAMFGAALMGMLKNLLNRSKHTEDKVDGLRALNEKALREMTQSNLENMRSNKEMVHYMRWMAENLNGLPEWVVEALLAASA